MLRRRQTEALAVPVHRGSWPGITDPGHIHAPPPGPAARPRRRQPTRSSAAKFQFVFRTSTLERNAETFPSSAREVLGEPSRRNVETFPRSARGVPGTPEWNTETFPRSVVWHGGARKHTSELFSLFCFLCAILFYSIAPLFGRATLCAKWPERSSDRNEQPRDRATERATEQPSDRATERSTEQPSDRATERYPTSPSVGSVL